MHWIFASAIHAFGQWANIYCIFANKVVGLSPLASFLLAKVLLARFGNPGRTDAIVTRYTHCLISTVVIFLELRFITPTETIELTIEKVLLSNTQCVLHIPFMHRYSFSSQILISSVSQ
jgi:hypothetical protein